MCYILNVSVHSVIYIYIHDYSYLYKFESVCTRICIRTTVCVHGVHVDVYAYVYGMIWYDIEQWHIRLCIKTDGIENGGLPFLFFSWIRFDPIIV